MRKLKNIIYRLPLACWLWFPRREIRFRAILDYVYRIELEDHEWRQSLVREMQRRIKLSNAMPVGDRWKLPGWMIELYIRSFE